MRMKGLSLVELLIAVAILSILGAMSMSQFQAYKKRGYDVMAIEASSTLYYATEAWIASSWSKQNIGKISWTRFPDGTVESVGAGLELVDFIDVDKYHKKPMLLLMFVDTACLLNDQTCSREQITMVQRLGIVALVQIHTLITGGAPLYLRKVKVLARQN